MSGKKFPARPKNSNFLNGLSDDYLADLGRVVAAWSHIENSFDLLFLSIVVMLGASSGSMKNPRVALLGKSFKERVSLMRERLDQLNLSTDTMKEADRILSQLVKLRGERDEIAHGAFTPFFSPQTGIVPDAASLLIKSWKNQKPHEQKVFTQVQLKTVFTKLDALYWDLFQISLERPWVKRP